MTATDCLHFQTVPAIAPGDVFSACPMDGGFRVICLALAVDPASDTILVARVDTNVEDATQADVIVFRAEVGTAFDLVVQTTLTAQIWRCQAHEVIARLPVNLLNDIRNLRAGNVTPAVRPRLGIALLEPDADDRWSERAESLVEVRELAADCADAHQRLADSAPIADPALELGACPEDIARTPDLLEAGLWRLLDEPDFALGAWDQVTVLLQAKMVRLLDDPIRRASHDRPRLLIHGGAELESLRCDSTARCEAFAERLVDAVMQSPLSVASRTSVLRVATPEEAWEDAWVFTRPFRVQVADRTCLVGFQRAHDDVKV